LHEDGAYLAASKIDNNFNLSIGRVENALALHLFAINSFIVWSVLAGFVIIVAGDEFSPFTWWSLTNSSPYLQTVFLLIISMYCPLNI
jgi:hypothetical protein